MPIMVAISMRASISSPALKRGNLPVRKSNNMIPTDHISMASGVLAALYSDTHKKTCLQFGRYISVVLLERGSRACLLGLPWKVA